MPPKQRRKNLKAAFHGQSVQTVFGPCHSDRQTSQVSHLHHCVLANLKVYHYRPFPSSRLSTTDRLYPGFPARLLRCDLFHSMAGRKNICPIAAGVSLRPGIFQCTFCLPVSYPHMRHERIPGRDHLSRKSSSHKVLTEKHVLRGY